MGGNALPGKVTRMTRLQFEATKEKVLSTFQDNGVKTLIPIRSYEDKQDFGDIDFVMSVPGEMLPHVEHIIRSEFNVTEIVKNTQKLSFKEKERGEYPDYEFWSFDYRNSQEDKEGFQVDLILVPAEEFSSAYHYYNYNALGNLIGKIARKLGFKFGHQGLVYRMYDGYSEQANLYKSIVVCSNIYEVLDFLGFSSERYKMGFKTKKEIFEFVVSGLYFNPDLFLLENVNSASRIRDRKRTTYTEFLQYIKDCPSGYRVRPEPKFINLRTAMTNWPDFKDRFEKTKADLRKLWEYRTRLSGEKIMEWTGLPPGKELGEVMTKFRNQWTSEESRINFVLLMDDEELKANVISCQQKLKTLV